METANVCWCVSTMLTSNSVPGECFEEKSKPLTGDSDRRGSPLLTLPLDSLHCVASFLTPVDWSNLGQSGRSASNATREIFRRIRMHGFRCATEIVTAWVSLIRFHLCEVFMLPRKNVWGRGWDPFTSLSRSLKGDTLIVHLILAH